MAFLMKLFGSEKREEDIDEEEVNPDKKGKISFFQKKKKKRVYFPVEVICEIISFIGSLDSLNNFLILNKQLFHYIANENPLCCKNVMFILRNPMKFGEIVKKRQGKEGKEFKYVVNLKIDCNPYFFYSSMTILLQSFPNLCKFMLEDCPQILDEKHFDCFVGTRGFGRLEKLELINTKCKNILKSKGCWSIKELVLSNSFCDEDGFKYLKKLKKLTLKNRCFLEKLNLKDLYGLEVLEISHSSFEKTVGIPLSKQECESNLVNSLKTLSIAGTSKVHGLKDIVLNCSNLESLSINEYFPKEGDLTDDVLAALSSLKKICLVNSHINGKKSQDFKNIERLEYKRFTTNQTNSYSGSFTTGYPSDIKDPQFNLSEFKKLKVLVLGSHYAFFLKQVVKFRKKLINLQRIEVFFFRDGSSHLSQDSFNAYDWDKLFVKTLVFKKCAFGAKASDFKKLDNMKNVRYHECYFRTSRTSFKFIRDMFNRRDVNVSMTNCELGTAKKK